MNARRFTSFLVAVRDVDKSAHALLTKAARLAQRFAARLTLLHVIAVPYVAPVVDADIESSCDAETARQRAKLERTANRFRKLGIKVKCDVVWDYPAADAIVRYVLKTKPDVVLAESHHHNKLARWFIAHTDWELIRSCPCPLWLVKTMRLPDKIRAMTAIDPFHSHSKPVALDSELLQVAKIAAGSGRVGIAHVYPAPITMVAGAMGEPIWVEAPATERKRVEQRTLRAVRAYAERFAIANGDQFIEPGDPAQALPGLLKRWSANLLVMGVVSRSMLKRALIGHTAERVIDATNCDVLIVKPRSFKTPVGRRPNRATIPVPPI